MGIGLAFRTDDPRGTARPGRGDRRLALESVGARDVDGQVRGPDVVALGQVGLERTLLDVERDIGTRGEEGGQRERFEVRARQLAVAIGGGELLEGLGPEVVARARSDPPRADPRRRDWVGGVVASLIAAIVHPAARSSGNDCKMAASVDPPAVATRSGGGR